MIIHNTWTPMKFTFQGPSLKVYWNPAVPVHLHKVWGCFCQTMAELGGRHRDTRSSGQEIPAIWPFTDQWADSSPVRRFRKPCQTHRPSGIWAITFTSSLSLRTISFHALPNPFWKTHRLILGAGGRLAGKAGLCGTHQSEDFLPQKPLCYSQTVYACST